MNQKTRDRNTFGVKYKTFYMIHISFPKFILYSDFFRKYDVKGNILSVFHFLLSTMLFNSNAGGARTHKEF